MQTACSVVSGLQQAGAGACGVWSTPCQCGHVVLLRRSPFHSWQVVRTLCGQGEVRDHAAKWASQGRGLQGDQAPGSPSVAALSSFSAAALHGLPARAQAGRRLAALCRHRDSAAPRFASKPGCRGHSHGRSLSGPRQRCTPRPLLWHLTIAGSLARALHAALAVRWNLFNSHPCPTLHSFSSF